MSRSAVSGDLECIYRLGRRGGANVGLQRFAAHYVNGFFEQVGDIGFETGVFPHADRSLRRKVDQDIDVAVGTVIATCARAEQRSMGDAALSQGALVLPEAI